MYIFYFVLELVDAMVFSFIVHVERNVLQWYPMLSFSRHLRRGYRKMINRYGLRVCHCIVPKLIYIGSVVPNWLPLKDVVEFLYMFPTISTTSRGYSRSSMMARSCIWSMEPKAFLKSMYVRYMSFAVSLASFRVAMIVWICLDVLRCGRNPSWLKCSIRCCSP